MTTYLLLTLALLSIAPCLQWWWIDNNLPGAAAPRVSVLSPFQPARMGEWLSLEEAESSDSLPGQRLSNLLPACREWSWLKPSRWGTWRPVSLIFPRGKMEFFFSQNNFFTKNQFFKKGMSSQKILLTESSQIPSMRICICCGGSIQGLQNTASDGLWLEFPTPHSIHAYSTLPPT